jgi:hypothetical protein
MPLNDTWEYHTSLAGSAPAARSIAKRRQNGACPARSATSE